MRKRTGLSLVELLVVVAILGVLIALLLPAVQNVREAALRLRTANNLRQISVGLHHYESAQNQLPVIGDGPGVWRKVGPYFVMIGDTSLFVSLLPYLDVGFDPFRPYPTIRMYISPTDPSLTGVRISDDVFEPNGAGQKHFISFGANAFAFVNHPSLVNGFHDGTSNTFAIVERYGRCFTSSTMYHATGRTGISSFDLRRATFADGGPVFSGSNYKDVYPITVAGGTGPSRPGVTYQVRPKTNFIPSAQFAVGRSPTADECDPALPQSTTRAGLLAALTDGSVRTIRSSISPETFWGAVTPAGGEVLGDW